MCLGNVLFQERQFAQIEFLSFFLQHTDFVFLLYSRQNMITIITTPVITVVILNSRIRHWGYHNLWVKANFYCRTDHECNTHCCWKPVGPPKILLLSVFHLMFTQAMCISMCTTSCELFQQTSLETSAVGNVRPFPWQNYTQVHLHLL